MPHHSLVFRCKECGWVGPEGAIVRFSDPELPSNFWNIYPAPACRAAESLENMCDEPGCVAVASLGYPVGDDDYRRTCYQHWAASQ